MYNWRLDTWSVLVWSLLVVGWSSVGFRFFVVDYFIDYIVVVNFVFQFEFQSLVVN